VKLLRSVERRAGAAGDLLRAYLPARTGEAGVLGVFLGPYRNLTTLSAAVLSLHPDCRVLNHALDRIVGAPGIDPFAPAGSPRHRRFVRFALAASEGGGRGNFGGSITKSHAFDRDAMREAARRAPEPSTGRPSAVVWKESMKVTDLLRLRGQDPVALSRANPALRFVLPVRNPLDCAASNVRTGHARYLAVTDPNDVAATLDAVLVELRAFVRCRDEHPPGFHLFFEDDPARPLLTGLASFLGLSPDPAWLEVAVDAWRPENRHEHPPALRARYEERVGELFADHPELAARLRALAG
jgi:hypothetical protein